MLYICWCCPPQEIKPPNAYHIMTLQWHNNGHNGVSNHQQLDSLSNYLLWPTSKKHQGSVLLALWEGNSPVTGEFPTQRASNAEKASIWWRHHKMGHIETSVRLLNKLQILGFFIGMERNIMLNYNIYPHVVWVILAVLRFLYSCKYQFWNRGSQHLVSMDNTVDTNLSCYFLSDDGWSLNLYILII